MTDEKVNRLRDLVSTQSDVAGWLVLIFAFLLIGFGQVEVWVGGVALVFLGLAALLGGSFAKGIALGPLRGPNVEEADGE